MGNQSSKNASRSVPSSATTVTKTQSAGWNHPSGLSPTSFVSSAQMHTMKRERAPDDKMTDHDYLEGVVAYASSAMQGKRAYMEDVHVACLSLPHPQTEMRSRRKSLLDLFRSASPSVDDPTGQPAPRRRSVWQSVSEVFSSPTSSDANREAAMRAASSTYSFSIGWMGRQWLEQWLQQC